jgi:ankyrin repeat protein
VKTIRPVVWLSIIAFWIEMSSFVIAQQQTLFHAIDEGDEHLVVQLLNQGADPDVEDTTGNSALMYALYIGQPGIAALLIERGANVNFSNSIDATPLMLAAFTGRKELCELLLKRGAKASKRNSKGKTALMLAVERVDTAIVKLLCGSDVDLDLDRGDDMYHSTALIKATMLGQATMMETFLKKGADRNCKLISGVTPLMIAAAFGNIQTLQLLLEYGADPEKQSSTFRVNESISMVRGGTGDVLKKTIFWSPPTVYGYSALMLAAKAGHIRIVRELLRRGVDVDEENSKGETAIDLANKEGHGQIVALLKNWREGNTVSKEIDSSLAYVDNDVDQDEKVTEKVDLAYIGADEPVFVQGIAVVRVCVDKDGNSRDAYILRMNVNLMQMFYVNEIIKAATGRWASWAALSKGGGRTWLNVPVEINGITSMKKLLQLK